MKPEADVCAIWKVPLGTAAVPTLPLHLLRSDERERTARFHHSRDRERFMGCRSALRALLGICLNREPHEIEFIRGPHGRPELPGYQAIRFNVTHSGDLGLIAIARSGPVGVDVECIREMKNSLRLARRYLTPAECAEVEAAGESVRSETFLTCWTRKEALLKSTGNGLTLDPRSVETGGKTGAIVLEWPVSSCSQVRVASIDVGAGFVAACAMPERISRIDVKRFGLD